LRRGKVIGGTSWLTRFAVRGGAADFDAWAARGNPGWGFADVLPVFRSIETDAEFGTHPWHGQGGPVNITRYPSLARSDVHLAALEALAAAGFAPVPDHNAPDAVGVGPMPMSTHDGLRMTTLDAYLPPSARPPRLTIMPEAQVSSVAIEGGRASGVRLVDGTLISAELVVLSAGVYGSPPILLRSGLGPASHLRELGIEVMADLPGVGANLADHSGVDLDSGWRGDPAAPAPILHSIATFRSSSQPATAPPDLMFWISDPGGDEPGFYLDPILLKPAARGTVRLRSADPADKPRITLPEVREQRDLDRLAEGYRLGIELANHPLVRRQARDEPPVLPSDAQLAERIVEASYSLPHVVGTCRMGPSPADGDVVDSAGRVHGVERLHIADASVIPDASAGFPQIVTVMVAERLAGMLIENRKGAP
jgi:choline dehydrogenase